MSQKKEPITLDKYLDGACKQGSEKQNEWIKNENEILKIKQNSKKVLLFPENWFKENHLQGEYSPPPKVSDDFSPIDDSRREIDQGLKLIKERSKYLKSIGNLSPFKPI